MSSSILAAAVLALCLPMVAAAQWPDNGRNRDGNDRHGRYDERYVKDQFSAWIAWRKTLRKKSTARWIQPARWHAQ